VNANTGENRSLDSATLRPGFWSSDLRPVRTDRIAQDGPSPATRRVNSCIRCYTKRALRTSPILPIDTAARCAPPGNKPLPVELANCSSYLDREFGALQKLRVVVALGKIAFDAYLNYLQRRCQLSSRKPYLFRHGASYDMPDGKILLASYHPSNQNTQTGVLTRVMFVKVFEEARRLAGS